MKIFKPVRAGIFVEQESRMVEAPSGAASSEYVIPAGLNLLLGFGFYKDVAPTALWSARTCPRSESGDVSPQSKIVMKKNEGLMRFCIM
jgi:hypothetical protein